MLVGGLGRPAARLAAENNLAVRRRELEDELLTELAGIGLGPSADRAAALVTLEESRTGLDRLRKVGSSGCPCGCRLGDEPSIDEPHGPPVLQIGSAGRFRFRRLVMFVFVAGSLRGPHWSSLWRRAARLRHTVVAEPMQLVQGAGRAQPQQDSLQVLCTPRCRMGKQAWSTPLQRDLAGRR